MQRICFGIFQRLDVESSSKNIGNKRKMSYLDYFKPWLMLRSLSGKTNTGNTNPSKQKLIWIGHTRKEDHKVPRERYFISVYSIRLYKFADNFGTPFFAPEESSI